MTRPHYASTLFLFIATLVGSSAHAERYAPQVGQPHADFVLPSVADRAPVALSDFRGKKVLLVHFASW